jgi:signal peptidase I
MNQPDTPENNNLNNNPRIRPSIEQLEKEIGRIETKRELKKAIFSTIRSLIIIAAAAVLVANLLIAVLLVNRTSMTPTLSEGEVVVALRWIGVNPGDIVAFHYNNKILLKRVIAKEGDWVNIDEDGTVYVNNEIIDEPYVTEKSLGECDITLPYQVPVGTIFVMGDHRAASADSRLNEIGPVSTELVVGKVFLRLWPLNRIAIFG